MSPHPAARRTVTPEAMAFSTMFGLAPYLATLLADLYAGGPVLAMRVHIHHLRTAMECEAIDTTPNGYQLTDTGREECCKAFEEFRAWVRGLVAA